MLGGLTGARRRVDRRRCRCLHVSAAALAAAAAPVAVVIVPLLAAAAAVDMTAAACCLWLIWRRSRFYIAVALGFSFGPWVSLLPSEDKGQGYFFGDSRLCDSAFSCCPISLLSNGVMAALTLTFVLMLNLNYRFEQAQT